MALRWIQINQSWGSLFWEIVGITCFRLLVVTVDVDMGNTLKKSFSYFQINFIFSHDNESQKSFYKSCLFTIFCYVWWLLSTWCKSHFVLVIILRRSEPAVDPFLFSYNLNSGMMARVRGNEILMTDQWPVGNGLLWSYPGHSLYTDYMHQS